MDFTCNYYWIICIKEGFKKLFDEYGADYFYFALKHTMNLEKRVNKDETEKEKIIKERPFGR